VSRTKEKKGHPLNLRDFPHDLYWLVKQCAAHKQMHLKAYIIAALEEVTERDSKLWK
jgi:hypothetical protein